MPTNMPKVDIKKAEESIYKNYFEPVSGIAILHTVVKKDGTIRASKPKVKDGVTGKSAYVWRMVCFMVSPKPAHQCMPCTADFDLPAIKPETGKWGCFEAREMAKTLKPIEDAIINAIDKKEWHGVHRWGQAFGI